MYINLIRIEEINKIKLIMLDNNWLSIDKLEDW